MTVVDAEAPQKKEVLEVPEEVRMDVPLLTAPDATDAPVNPVSAVSTPIAAQPRGTKPVSRNVPTIVMAAAEDRKEELREAMPLALQMDALPQMVGDATDALVNPVSAIKTPIVAPHSGTVSAWIYVPLTAAPVAVPGKLVGAGTAPLTGVRLQRAQDVMGVPAKPVPVLKTVTAAIPPGTMCA